MVNEPIVYCYPGILLINKLLITIYFYCIVLYCIVLYCIVLYCIVLYCIVLYCIVLYCIVLYCIVLYCIVLYCIVLYNEKIAMNFQLEDMLRPCGRIESILLYIEVADTSTRLLRSSNPPPSP